MSGEPGACLVPLPWSFLLEKGKHDLIRQSWLGGGRRRTRTGVEKHAGGGNQACVGMLGVDGLRHKWAGEGSDGGF